MVLNQRLQFSVPNCLFQKTVCKAENYSILLLLLRWSLPYNQLTSNMFWLFSLYDDFFVFPVSFSTGLLVADLVFPWYEQLRFVHNIILVCIRTQLAFAYDNVWIDDSDKNTSSRRNITRTTAKATRTTATAQQQSILWSELEEAQIVKKLSLIRELVFCNVFYLTFDC